MVALSSTLRSLPSATVFLPETVRAGVREDSRRTTIESHLTPRLAAAATAQRQSQPVILDLEATDVTPPGQTAYETLSGFQVLVTYLSHDLTTPLSAPPLGKAPGTRSARSATGTVQMPADLPRYTWDDQIMPDRPGSFVNSYV